MSKLERLATLAERKLGTDFTDDSKVDDEVSCVYALTTVLNQFDRRIPVMVSTVQLDNWLDNSPLFRKVPQPIGIMERGFICVTPTKGASVGHCGLYLDDFRIVSNSSFSKPTGLWLQNYTRETWRRDITLARGLNTRIYEYIG